MKQVLISLQLLFILFNLNISAQCVNGDFEATAPGAYTSVNAVNGWEISSQNASCIPSNTWVAGSPEFSIVSTPVFMVPHIGTLPVSPLGGSKVAQLNNFSANGMVTRLTQTFVPNSVTMYFQVAYAGIWQGGTHNCCEEAGFKILLRDPSGTEVTCPSFDLAGPDCIYAPSYTSGVTWTGWQVKQFDLSLYVNQQISIEILAKDCIHGDHYGTLFFDAQCPVGPLPVPCNCSFSVPFAPVISFCANTTTATIALPHGYPNYVWQAPPGYPVSAPNASLSTLTITNALAGNVYTVSMIKPFCYATYTATLVPTTVSISALGSNASCANGASGSATVSGTGSGAGYTYAWTSSTGSVVGTASTVTGLSTGIYSVQLSAPGSPGCGTAGTTVQIATSAQSLIVLAQVYCGNEAYLNPGGGSNFKWYNGSTAIPAGQGGTAPSYTVTAPVNGAAYHLSYTSPFGCKDSVKYVLISTTPGSLNVHTPLACLNSTNAAATVTLVPAPGSAQGANYFYISSTGTTAPYSASLNPTSFYTFNASGLSAGGTYSVQAYDGSCNYSKSFSVTPVVVDYSVFVSPSATLCAGQSAGAAVSFKNPGLYAEHTYTWQGAGTLFGAGSPNLVIAPPSASPGTTLALAYTVVVTPTVVPCPLAQTFTLTLANLLTPSIAPIPTLCASAAPFTITANPSWGTFINHAAVSTNGVLQPSLASPGSHTVVYHTTLGPCTASTSASFSVVPGPNLSVSAANLSVCAGEQAMLSAQGAATYSLNNLSSAPHVTLNPLVTTTYTITGASTEGCRDSKLVTIQVDPCTGLAAYTNPALPNVYPNPSSGGFYFENQMEVALVVKDVMGKVILERQLPAGKNLVDLSVQAKGIYFLEYRYADKFYTIKLVKEN